MDQDSGDAVDQCKAAMARLGISQSELERRVGVSRGAASAWFARRKQPRIQHAVAIQSILNVRVEAWALSAAPTPPEAA